MSTSSSPSMIVPPWAANTTSILLDRLDPALNYTWVGVACLTFLIIYLATRAKNPYDDIPAVGRTGLVSSYLDAQGYTKGEKDFIAEGYAKYKNRIFRVPEKAFWRVIVSGRQFTDELRKAPDDVLSFMESVRDFSPAHWTLKRHIGDDHYHVSVIKNQITRNLPLVFADLTEEIVLSFNDKVPPTTDWTKVTAYSTVMHIVSRTSNRVFVGTPLCHDPEYLDLNVQFTLDVSNGQKILSKFPDMLKMLVAHLFTNLPQSLGITLKFLKPIIEERLRNIEAFGSDYPDKPNDLISWLLDEAPSEERTAERITYRLLMLNFAAIHTTSITLTGALFALASRPEYMEPLRQEVEAVIGTDGWTKVAMTRMRKLDSFLKESQRVRPLASVSLSRRALKEFAFSDGTRIPKGAYVAAVVQPSNLDDEVYHDANTFNGFRFSDIREEEGEGAKHQMVSTSNEYLLFGHGKHACPGRFFAVNELKAMMAHVVMTYDLKMIDTPRYTSYGPANMPDMNQEVWFRKRRM